MALDVVEFPEDIAWLDLSFNEITDVTDDIEKFKGRHIFFKLNANNCSAEYNVQ